MDVLPAVDTTTTILKIKIKTMTNNSIKASILFISYYCYTQWKLNITCYMIHKANKADLYYTSKNIY